MAQERSAESEAPSTAARLAQNLEAVAALARDVLAELARTETSPTGVPDVAHAFATLTARMLADSAQGDVNGLEQWARSIELWQNVAARALDPSVPPLIDSQPGDRRFRDPAWDANPFFDLMKQQHLLASSWVEEQMREMTGVDPVTAQRVAFFTRQYMQALAPSNFLLTNPEALRATFDSKGENLLRGLANMLADLERGKGRLRVRTSDLEAFELGRDLAVTPGKVVFQNKLIQLIQYEPSTERVYRQPLLVVPPWINKYYVLDLRPENSFVRWAVERGYTVFVISWANPDETFADTTFEDYLTEGALAAMDAVAEATGERTISALGYCIGGTLLSATLAHLAAKEDARVAACTLLAAQVDFAESGELAVFASEPQIEALERRMAANGGYLDADTTSATFSMLRANDLIWSYVVSGYLLGREPAPFDLLFWNADSTRMPAPMESYYLRNMYLRNALVDPGALELAGTPIDLTRVAVPTYLQAGREDHIAPYGSVFRVTQHLGGPTRFVLSGSGHIAGVINPPSANKYGYVVNEHGTFDDVAAWLERAEEHEGSWWPDWNSWLASLSGPQVPARHPGDGALAVIEDAPGSYVLVSG